MSIDRIQKRLLAEVSILTVSLVAITSLLNFMQSIDIVARFYGVIFTLLFVMFPVFAIHGRGERIDFLDVKFRNYLKSILIYIVASIIVFPIFLIAAHFWERIVYSASGPNWVLIPDFWLVAANQLVIIALPEEFFFRGYMQSALNRVFKPKWQILGAKLGWGWIATAAVFAVAHSFIVLEWWHFAIFFPALFFGYLRERTGSITAPILFHTTSNIVMNCVAMMYR